MWYVRIPYFGTSIAYALKIVMLRILIPFNLSRHTQLTYKYVCMDRENRTIHITDL